MNIHPRCQYQIADKTASNVRLISCNKPATRLFVGIDNNYYFCPEHKEFVIDSLNLWFQRERK